jgi:hypothetical protein
MYCTVLILSAEIEAGYLKRLLRNQVKNNLIKSYKYQLSIRLGQNVVIPEILKVVLKERHGLALVNTGHNT